MKVPFALVKNDKILMTADFYENLEEFVEALKKLNPEFVDRRKYQVISGDTIIKEWKKK